MIKYEDLDQYIEPFLIKYGLHVYKISAHDTSIRSIDVVDDSGDVYQINITINENNISIGIWDKKVDGKGKTSNCKISSFENKLTKAYEKIEDWITSSGKSRTPV
ncbi:hypothetical protein D1AOALGA4SA_8450 [Olavius algarvensis Delta 1 endosymbiont]|nr:hypothetical protein D1AOALGA4SA_8450 [Olavius algarvensis Delta 1 endosymbiont]